MTKSKDWHRWFCPHGFETGFFPVPGEPNLVEHRSCGICCDEISEKMVMAASVEKINSGHGEKVPKK